MIPIPRFSGSAIKEDDKWGFEFIVSMLGESDGQRYGSKKLYDTKDEAIQAMRFAIHDAIKILAKEIPELGINPDNYIDMKTNDTRKWSGSNEH